MKAQMDSFQTCLDLSRATYTGLQTFDFLVDVVQFSTLAAQPPCKPGLVGCKTVRFVEAKRPFSQNGQLAYPTISLQDRSWAVPQAFRPNLASLAGSQK